MLPVNVGGTGAAALAANGVLVGDSAGLSVLTVAPSTSGNVLTSNGTAWASAAPAAGAAGTLTGTTLASNVVASSLTSVGTLTSLTVSGIITGGKGLAFTPFSAGNTGTALTLNWNNGAVQTCTANNDVTFTLSNPVAGVTYTIEITQDATGSRSYTWPGSVKWSGGTAPTGSGANKIDLITLFYDGTNYLGRSNLNY